MTFIKARSCILPKLQDLFASLSLFFYSPKICTHKSQHTHKTTKRVFSVATVTQTQPRTTYPEIYSSKLTSDQLYRLNLQAVSPSFAIYCLWCHCEKWAQTVYDWRQPQSRPAKSLKSHQSWSPQKKKKKIIWRVNLYLLTVKIKH